MATQPLVGLVAVFFAVGIAAASGVAASAPLKPPVIQETFTPLPCHHMKYGIDPGCVEREVLKTDKMIDSRVRVIFGLLRGADQRTFVAAERAWLKYRTGSCLVAASPSIGGQVHASDVALCTKSRNDAHLMDLGRILKSLRFH